MCIALISTAHPDYKLIVLSNRDEFLARPTAKADWWDAPNSHVLGGRDLLRHEKGTWLGVTQDGRIAVLTNFREEGAQNLGKVSRGQMINEWLLPPADAALGSADFAGSLVNGEGARGSGGFSLVCGRMGDKLAVVSNRTPDADGITWIADTPGQTKGLSNAAFGDHSWPKVVDGERLLREAIRDAVAENWHQDTLVERLLELLSTDSLPERRDGEDWEIVVKELRKSIFIPAIGGQDGSNSDELAAAKSNKVISVEDATSGAYGTQKQTIVLVDSHDRVTFVERSLFEQEFGRFRAATEDRRFSFQIQSLDAGETCFIADSRPLGGKDKFFADNEGNSCMRIRNGDKIQWIVPTADGWWQARLEVSELVSAFGDQKPLHEAKSLLLWPPKAVMPIDRHARLVPAHRIDPQIHDVSWGPQPPWHPGRHSDMTGRQRGRWVWPRDGNMKRSPFLCSRRWKDVFSGKGPAIFVGNSREFAPTRETWTNWRGLARNGGVFDNLGYCMEHQKCFRPIPHGKAYDFRTRRYVDADLPNLLSDIRCPPGRHHPVPWYFRDGNGDEYVVRNSPIDPNFPGDNDFAYDPDHMFWNWTSSPSLPYWLNHAPGAEDHGREIDCGLGF